MSYPIITNAYPSYDDYNKRYYNHDNYFHNNQNVKRNMSPIILFNDPRAGSRFSAFTKKPARKQLLSSKLKKPKTFAKTSLLDTLIIWKKILKLLFILMCCALCCYQTVDIVNKYFSYPMDVNVMVKEMKLLPLPGITICNNNIIYRELLFEKFPDLEQQFNGSIKDIADYVHKANEGYLWNRSLNQILDMSQEKDNFIESIECDKQIDELAPNAEEEKAKKCDEKEVIRSLQRNGICFTYFHTKAKDGQKKDDSNCKMMGMCSSKEPVFDTNEIARFEINFRPDEYTSKDFPVSGKISIHDNSEIGDSLSNAYNLEPGYYYQFFIKVQSTSMLPKPYGTNCIDYIEVNSLLFNSTPDFSSVPLSRRQCSVACMSKSAIGGCNCWPPEMPYIKIEGIVNEMDINTTKTWCNWKFGMEEFQNTYGSCFGKEKRTKCSMGCQPSCWQDHYEISVQKLAFEYYGREGWDSENKKLKRTRSAISIRFWSTERTIHEYSPMFTILDMVCNVGGLVSMYTGLSFVALYDYMILIYLFTKKYV